MIAALLVLAQILPCWMPGAGCKSASPDYGDCAKAIDGNGKTVWTRLCVVSDSAGNLVSGYSRTCEVPPWGMTCTSDEIKQYEKLHGSQ